MDATTISVTDTAHALQVADDAANGPSGEVWDWPSIDGDDDSEFDCLVPAQPPQLADGHVLSCVGAKG